MNSSGRRHLLYVDHCVLSLLNDFIKVLCPSDINWLIDWYHYARLACLVHTPRACVSILEFSG